MLAVSVECDSAAQTGDLHEHHFHHCLPPCQQTIRRDPTGRSVLVRAPEAADCRQLAVEAFGQCQKSDRSVEERRSQADRSSKD